MNRGYMAQPGMEDEGDSSSDEYSSGSSYMDSMDSSSGSESGSSISDSEPSASVDPSTSMDPSTSIDPIAFQSDSTREGEPGDDQIPEGSFPRLDRSNSDLSSMSPEGSEDSSSSGSSYDGSSASSEDSDDDDDESLTDTEVSSTREKDVAQAPLLQLSRPTTTAMSMNTNKPTTTAMSMNTNKPPSAENNVSSVPPTTERQSNEGRGGLLSSLFAPMIQPQQARPAPPPPPPKKLADEEEESDEDESSYSGSSYTGSSESGSSYESEDTPTAVEPQVAPVAPLSAPPTYRPGRRNSITRTSLKYSSTSPEEPRHHTELPEQDQGTPPPKANNNDPNVLLPPLTTPVEDPGDPNVYPGRPTRPGRPVRPTDPGDPHIFPRPNDPGDPHVFPRPNDPGDPNVYPPPMSPVSDPGDPNVFPRPNDPGDPNVFPRPNDPGDPHIFPPPNDPGDPNIFPRPRPRPDPGRPNHPGPGRPKAFLPPTSQVGESGNANVYPAPDQSQTMPPALPIAPKQSSDSDSEESDSGSEETGSSYETDSDDSSGSSYETESEFEDEPPPAETMSNSKYFENVPSQSKLYPVSGFEDRAAIEITKPVKVNSLTRRFEHEFDAPPPAEMLNVGSSYDPNQPRRSQQQQNPQPLQHKNMSFSNDYNQRQQHQQALQDSANFVNAAAAVAPEPGQPMRQSEKEMQRPIMSEWDQVQLSAKSQRTMEEAGALSGAINRPSQWEQIDLAAKSQRQLEEAGAIIPEWEQVELQNQHDKEYEVLLRDEEDVPKKGEAPLEIIVGSYGGSSGSLKEGDYEDNMTNRLKRLVMNDNGSVRLSVILLIWIVGIAIMTGVGVAVSDNSPSSSTSPATNNQSTAPTMTPILRCNKDGTPNTNVVVDDTEESLRYKELRAELEKVIDTRNFDEICSPYDQALRWIADGDDQTKLGNIFTNNDFAQRYGAALLYYSTSGPSSWRVNSGWLSDTHECSWKGVSCNSAEVVLGISLENSGLVGTIPQEIAFFRRLETLDLSRNEISGSIPFTLYDITQLSSLKLNENLLIGELSRRIGSLSKLVEIDVSGNKLTGNIPDEVYEAPAIRHIFLNRNEFSGQMPTIDSLVRYLETLDLEDNVLTGTITEVISRMSRLRILRLGGNNLTGFLPRRLGNVRSLEEINFSGNDLRGRLPNELFSLTNLRLLDLSFNKISGALPVDMKELGKLVLLQLHENELTGQLISGLSTLTNLELLTLHNNEFTGTIPASFGALNKIGLMDLRFNYFIGSVPDEVCFTVLQSDGILRADFQSSGFTCDCCRTGNRMT